MRGWQWLLKNDSPSCKLLPLDNFNRFISTLYEEQFFLVRAATVYIYGSCFSFWGIGASLNFILFFSHLLRVISSDNLSTYEGTLFHFSDFLRKAVWRWYVPFFPKQSVTIKRDFIHLSCFHRQALSSIELVFECRKSVLKRKETDWQLLIWLVFPLIFGLSLNGWSLFFWSLHIWCKILSNPCYLFLPLSLFHCFSQVATTFTFTSETSVILLLLKRLPPNATKKLLVKVVEDNLGEVFFDVIRRDVQLRHFILLSGQLITNCPDLLFLLL